MKTTAEVFGELKNELKRRKFLFQRLNNNEHFFEAHNPYYAEKRILIRAQEQDGRGLVIIIACEDGTLPACIQDKIMCGYMEFFDLNEKGAVELCIPQELGTNRDMGDVANVITRAYGLAITA